MERFNSANIVLGQQGEQEDSDVEIIGENITVGRKPQTFKVVKNDDKKNLP